MLHNNVACSLITQIKTKKRKHGNVPNYLFRDWLTTVCETIWPVPCLHHCPKTPPRRGSATPRPSFWHSSNRPCHSLSRTVQSRHLAPPNNVNNNKKNITQKWSVTARDDAAARGRHFPGSSGVAPGHTRRHAQSRNRSFYAETVTPFQRHQRRRNTVIRYFSSYNAFRRQNPA